jgi:CheY-like chemotaxis protein
MRILVVDDHEDCCELCAMAFRVRGHDVCLAGSVAEAVERYVDPWYDVVVCDIRLPDGDGWSLMRTLAAHHKTTAVAVSGLGYAADIERSRQAGFVTHLTKPIDLDRLVETVESLQPCA